MYLSENSQLAV